MRGEDGGGEGGWGGRGWEGRGEKRGGREGEGGGEGWVKNRPPPLGEILYPPPACNNSFVQTSPFYHSMCKREFSYIYSASRGLTIFKE